MFDFIARVCVDPVSKLAASAELRHAGLKPLVDIGQLFGSTKIVP
jgi:hypothetical protein